MKAVRFSLIWATLISIATYSLCNPNQLDSKRLELPFGHSTKLVSPAGRYILVGKSKHIDVQQNCAGCGSVTYSLWLEIVNPKRISYY
jgi:hypothetical protein